MKNLLVLIVVMFFVTGCSPSKDKYTSKFVKDKLALLKTQSGIEFKHKIKLLNYKNSKRDTEYNKWLIFSETRIKKNLKNCSKNFIRLFSLSAKHVIEEDIGRKIAEPTKSYSGRWMVGEKQISLFLVEAPGGDYLDITIFSNGARPVQKLKSKFR